MARVALVGPFWPYRGGIAHFSTALAGGLQRRGHSVRAATFRRQYPSLLFPGTSQLEGGSPPAEAPQAVRLLDSLNPISWYQTARQIAREGADVAILAYWTPFLAPAMGTVARLLKRWGVRVLCVVHNAIPHERRPGDLILGRYLLQACDGLMVMSDTVEEDVRRLAADVPLRKAGHPTYESFGEAVPRAAAREELGLPADAPVFLFFGFVRPYKGLHVLLDAFGEVVLHVPNARLVVAGEFYEGEDALRNQAAPLGAAVRFDAGYISNESVPLYFSAADAVVQPYTSATQSGVAQLAFQYGRPVITTDVGGLAESVPHEVAGLVVPPENPRQLAAALVRFVRDDLAGPLSAGAERQREQSSWSHFLNAVEGLMEDARYSPPKTA